MAWPLERHMPSQAERELGKSHEFKLHFRGAINNGLTLEELREVLIQIAVYCGIPAGVEAFRNAREVVEDMNIDTSTMDPGKS